MTKNEHGFSLMEAIVATVITVIAVLGLAHTFAMGRGFIDRFEVARVALATVQGRLESLSAQQPSGPDLAIGTHPPTPVPFAFPDSAHVIGTETWRVEPFNDPVTPGTQGLKRVTVVVRWGVASNQDSVTLTRLFPV